MADKYYRLVTILVDICPGPLRELFLKEATADPNLQTPYTTLDAYLAFRKYDIKKLFQMPKYVLRKDQLDLLFPHAGQTDISSWDVTLLTALLKNMFNLAKNDLVFIENIRKIKNSLNHIPGTCKITEQEFKKMYNTLSGNIVNLAFSVKGQSYADEIEQDIKMVESSLITDLGGVYKSWYNSKLENLETEIEKLTNQIDEMKIETGKTTKTLKKPTVKGTRAGSKITERFKTVDPILENMRENCWTLLTKNFDNDFTPPPETERIIKEIEDNHLVVVSGYDKGQYLQATLSAINSKGYEEGGCILCSSPTDWRYIGNEDAELVVFFHPFGEDTFDFQKAKDFHSIVDSIVETTSSRDNDDVLDVVIMMDQSILEEWKRHFSHDMMEQPIVVYKSIIKDSPMDLIEVTTQSSMTDQKKLNMIWKSTHENRAIIYEECERICQFIENMSSSIVHVWPAYDTNANDDIVFVVLTTKNIEGNLQVKEALKKTGYNVFVTHVDSCSKESEQVLQKVDQLRETNQCFSKLEDLGSVINKHSDRLLRNHQYLSAISGSNVRSERFSLGQSEHFVSFQPCIVLYVIAKGKIPLHENKFEDHLDGVPVDVREGVFQRTILPSARYSNPVKMGCQITSNRTSGSFGTLGGFFYHKDFGFCGVTCAHVVLEEAMLHDLRGEKKVWSNEESPMVFHPNTTRQEYRLGPVKEAVYRTGSEDSSGIDIAFFKIESAAPDSGFFPEQPELCFETGRTLGTSDLQYNTPVLKYGRTTALTRGYIVYENTTVRLTKFDRKYTLGSQEYTFLLKNQIAVRPEATSSSQLFIDYGDSGAFVFMKDSDNQLVCIGMCVGKLNSHGIVIPISAVKENLGISNFCDFRWHHLSEKINEMDKKLNMILERLPSSSSN